MAIVDSTSREALIGQAIVNMLADCAIFQSIVGATDLPTAKAYIVEGYGGRMGAFRSVDTTPINALNPFAIVALGDIDDILRARDTFGWEGDGKIDLNLPITLSDDPASMFRRARNWQGSVREQLKAKIGLTTATGAYQALARLQVNPRRIILADDLEANRLHLVATLDLDLGDIP